MANGRGGYGGGLAGTGGGLGGGQPQSMLANSNLLAAARQVLVSLSGLSPSLR